MNAKELFRELRLFVRDIGVLLSAMPLEAGAFEEVEKEEDEEGTNSFNRTPSGLDKVTTGK